MAKDVSDAVRDALGQAVRNAIKNAGDANPAKPKRSPLSGARGVAAGAGLAALAPLAYKGVEKLRLTGLPTPDMSGVASKAGDVVGSKLKDTVSDKVDEAGGAGGLVKEAASGVLPFGGGSDDDDDDSKGDGMPAVGKGRRMPVQQSVDVGVPLETAYNQWTQYEDWPRFMHRVTRVTQEDETTVSFATKIWGKTKEFTAKIETQRPDERVKWRVSQGITHSGVVTFHELAPNLTRIEMTVDVDPGSLIEKAARGMRHIKRAMRADLHRFKAFIEFQEKETGAWRGRIENGEVVEEHDESYDEDREYSEVDDIYEDPTSSEEDEDEDDEDSSDEDSSDEDDSQRSRTNRFKRQAEASGRGGSRAAAASRSSSSRSTGSGSGGGSSSKRSSSSRSSGSGSGSSSKRSSGSGSGSSSKRSSGGGSSSSTRANGSSKSSSTRSRSNGSSSKGSSTRSRSNGSSSKSSSSRSRSNGSGSSSSRRKASSSRS